MGDNLYVANVMTFETSTVVNYAYSAWDSELDPAAIAFHDANGNQELDTGDSKLSYYMSDQSNGKECQLDPDNKNYTACLTKVSSEDEKQFGKEVSQFFKKGQKDRNKLEKIIKENPFNSGHCTYDIRLSAPSIKYSATGDVKFEPPLGLETKIEHPPTGHVIRPLPASFAPDDKGNPPSFNPSQCNVASATITFGDRNEETIFSVGGYNTPTILGLYGLLTFFGLTDEEQVADVRIIPEDRHSTPTYFHSDLTINN